PSRRIPTQPPPHRSVRAASSDLPQGRAAGNDGIAAAGRVQGQRLTHFFTHHGLPLLFLVVMLESFGIPLPGETALIAFGVLAAQGHYEIVTVIAVAAAAAILGDNLGYWLIGRLGGRALFRRWAWLNRWAG